jgi:hypothetical protein
MKLARFALIIFAPVFGLVLALDGCGVKSAPIAPELVLPQRILDLRAAADPNGIKLIWERPTRYTGGHTMRDLSGFVILRSEGNGPAEPLVELPVTDRERFSVQRQFGYIDNETVVGRNYAYEIISRTSDGYVSQPSNQVTFTRVKPAPPPNPETYTLPTPTPLATPAS